MTRRMKTIQSFENISLAIEMTIDSRDDSERVEKS